MTDINKDSVSYNQFIYRRVFVEDGDIVSIPKGSKGVQIRPVAKKTESFVEWMEPVRND